MHSCDKNVACRRRLAGSCHYTCYEYPRYVGEDTIKMDLIKMVARTRLHWLRIGTTELVSPLLSPPFVTAEFKGSQVLQHQNRDRCLLPVP